MDPFDVEDRRFRRGQRRTKTIVYLFTLFVILSVVSWVTLIVYLVMRYKSTSVFGDPGDSFRKFSKEFLFHQGTIDTYDEEFEEEPSFYCVDYDPYDGSSTLRSIYDVTQEMMQAERNKG